MSDQNSDSDSDASNASDFFTFDSDSNELDMLQKLDVLRKIYELKQSGCLLSRQYDMQSDYNEMLEEYNFHKNVIQKNNKTCLLLNMVIIFLHSLSKLPIIKDDETINILKKCDINIYHMVFKIIDMINNKSIIKDILIDLDIIYKKEHLIKKCVLENCKTPVFATTSAIDFASGLFCDLKIMLSFYITEQNNTKNIDQLLDETQELYQLASTDKSYYIDNLCNIDENCSMSPLNKYLYNPFASTWLRHVTDVSSGIVTCNSCDMCNSNMSDYMKNHENGCVIM
jgi:hypothetical protein